jgi:hypothetical protein
MREKNGTRTHEEKISIDLQSITIATRSSSQDVYRLFCRKI